MPFPNLIIAGAPKCGTTSLFKYLSDHREVCGSLTKETFYFIDPSFKKLKNNNYWQNGIDGYKQYFKHCSKERDKLIVEATPDYMYQKAAPKIFREKLSEPTIIFVLRKPSERTFSFFNFLKNQAGLLDKGLTFSHFLWKSENDDKFREKYPVISFAVEHSKYINYLLYWFQQYNPAKIILLLYEDLRDDPRHFMKSLSKKLQIDPEFYSNYHFLVRKKTKEIRFKQIASLKRTARLPKHLERYRYYFQKIYALINLQKSNIEKTQDDRVVLQQLETLFLPFNERLENEFKLDLSKWRRA